MIDSFYEFLCTLYIVTFIDAIDQNRRTTLLNSTFNQLSTYISMLSSSWTEGWAEKQSHDMFQKWQERYFVIELKKITYYEVILNNKVVKKGEYSLDGGSVCRKVQDGQISGKKNVLLVTGRSRNNIMDDELSELFISVPSERLLGRWVDAINVVVKGESLEFLALETDMMDSSGCCNDYCTIA